jgi:4-hydroxybenzoate polyprenyltransferase
MRQIIRQIQNTATSFYIYQRGRFPLVILSLSLIPVTLSSGVVASGHPKLLQMVAALIASVAYLLLIRIIDEHRDFSHDNLHHNTRPVQVGVISKKELHYIGLGTVFVLIIIAASVGTSALTVVVVMLGYSYLAGKEFFIGEKFRRHFFTYNAINLVQMLLMQIFVYTIFANPFYFNKLILAHFLFTSVGTVIFEFVRKLKIPGQDGSGKDTYTWYLGFNVALAIYEILLISEITLFLWLASLISPLGTGILLLVLGLAVLASTANLVHKIKKTHQTDQLMQLAFLLLYGILNLAIYFIK